MSTSPAKRGWLLVSLGLAGLIPGACDGTSYRLGGRGAGDFEAGANGTSGEAGQSGQAGAGIAGYGGFPTGGGGFGGIGATGNIGGAFGRGGTSAGSGGGGMAGAGGIGGAGGVACDLSGRWAAYATLPLQWPASTVALEGVGTIQMWALIQRTSNGTYAIDTGQLCGVQLPSIDTVLNEKYGLRFLAEVFDYLPQFSVAARVSGQEARYDSDPAAIAFGVSLDNPLGYPWPPLPQLVPADDDFDGSPGVTTPVEKGAGFADPLVEITPPLARASTMYVASRAIVVMHGSVLACNEISGTLEIATIDGAPALNGAIIGCRLSDSDQACNPAQVEFVNTNAPHARPGASGAFTQLRAPDGTTCAEVRALFPAL
jgi:hypothetical protein